MNPLPLTLAMLRHNRFTSILFVVLIALATALGIAISAQERALRQGSARAADRFDLVVGAPGSHTDLLLSVVYLRPAATGLVPPEVLARLLAEPRARLVAPIGFGDSHHGDPVVGTTAAFVDHLSGGLAQGRLFRSLEEAVVGAWSPLRVGDRVEITHGDEEAHPEDAEGANEHELAPLVVGRMKPTGTPWDRAIVTPIEFNWAVHGLADGHAPGDTRIGPPFDAAAMPGVPAVVVSPQSVQAAYGLRSQYRNASSTAFFPAEVLVEIYALMGDVRRIMSWLTLAAQVLVVAAILAGILALLDLQRRRFAVLRALGASRGFVFLAVWSYVAILIVSGATLGLLLGWALAGLVSRLLAAGSGVAMHAAIGATELAFTGGLLLIGMALAMLPAALVYRHPVIDGLRQ